MVNSKINAKKYFLPVYVLWLVVTPTIVTYMAGLLAADVNTSAFSAIPWNRALSYYALFGLVWPLTMVISPAFFQSVMETTGYSFIEAFTTATPANADQAYDIYRARLGYFLFSVAWIGPLLSLIASFYFHKKDVSKQVEEPEKFGWIDYLAAFV